MDAASLVSWMIEQQWVRVPEAILDTGIMSRETADAIEGLIVAGLLIRWDDAGVSTITLTDMAAQRHRLTMHVDPEHDLEYWIGPDDEVPPVGLEFRLSDAEPVIVEADFRSPERANGLDCLVNHADPDPAKVIEAYETATREARKKRRKPVKITIDLKPKGPEKEPSEAEWANQAAKVWGRRSPNCDRPVKEKFPHPLLSMTGVRPWPVQGQERTNQGPSLPLLPRGGVNKLPKKGAIPIDGDLEYKGPCPICHGLPLPLWAECLCCSASGIDHLLEKVYPERKPKELPKPDGLAGGTGNKPKESRKSRRAKNRKNAG